METLITFSPKALQKIENLKESLSLDDSHFIRIGVKGGKGCIGVTPFIAFDHKSKEDSIHNIQGINVLINNTQTMHIVGYSIDYYEDNNSKGFVFESEDS